MTAEAVPTATAAGDRPIGYWLEADDVVRAGGLVRGIDVLTEANRVQRSTERERRLVELRNLAVPEAASTPGRDTWPPPFADPFPNGGLPEVSADTLTVETLGGSLRHHGCLVVRGLIKPAGVARLVSTIDSALGAVAARRARKSTPATEEWFSPFAGRAPVWGQGDEWLRVVDSPRGTYEVTETFRTIGPLITEYLGQRPIMGSYKWTLRRITPACIGEWHQDGSVLGPNLRVVNVWVALSRCGGDTLAPGLEFMPGRTDEYYSSGTEGASIHFSIAEHLVEQSGRPAYNPVLEPGDAVMLDEWIPHRTASREGLTDSRHAIEAWFFSPTACPDGQLSFVF